MAMAFAIIIITNIMIIIIVVIKQLHCVTEILELRRFRVRNAQQTRFAFEERVFNNFHFKFRSKFKF